LRIRESDDETAQFRRRSPRRSPVTPSSSAIASLEGYIEDEDGGFGRR
jgi:hypothetical protein